MKPRKPTTPAERREETLRRRLTDDEYKALSAPGSAELGKETKAHRLKPRKSSDLALTVPISFLLGCSQNALADFMLARQAGAADSRREMHAALDRLVQETALALLADWFRSIDPHDLKLALENPDDVMEWAREQIRARGRSEEEVERDLIPLPCLPPGAAHLAAAVRYAERNIAEGLCSVCPKPLAHHSVRYCDEHLAKARQREATKKGLSLPGGREYLYSGEVTESTHGRQPGTLVSLAINREKKTRALLAELGMSPEDAAVRREDAKKALLGAMPDKSHAMTQTELFEKAGIITKTTGQRALADLLAGKQIQRIGKGGPRDLYRYFKRDA